VLFRERIFWKDHHRSGAKSLQRLSQSLLVREYDTTALEGPSRKGMRNCTPGGVESDVGYAQRNFFAPIPKAKDFAELEHDVASSLPE
jgi:hypothetical protein